MKKTPTLAALAAGSLLFVPATDAATSKPPQKPGATYEGVTSQGRSHCRAGGSNDQPCAVKLKVSGNGGRVRKLQIYFFADCDDGKVFRSSTIFENPPISARGKFKNDSTYSETLGDGSKAKDSVAVTGRFRHKGKRYIVTGTYSIDAKLRLDDGTSTKCSSDNVTYKARV
jgi:hypothetical protein